jgi:Tfp pilus assembly protein PilF
VPDRHEQIAAAYVPKRPATAVKAARAVALLLALALLLQSGGCASWRGARLYHSGTQALEAGDVETALADLEAASVLVPEASEIQNNLGLARLAAGEDDLALQSFERATQLDCDNAAAHDNLLRLETKLQAERRRAAVSRIAGQSGSGDGP